MVHALLSYFLCQNTGTQRKSIGSDRNKLGQTDHGGTNLYNCLITKKKKRKKGQFLITHCVDLVQGFNLGHLLQYSFQATILKRMCLLESQGVAIQN